MVYSFDIFDTLITRTTATPHGIFALMQWELCKNNKYNQIDDYVRNNFYQLRINAEDLARANYQRDGIEDITLEQIYEALSTIGNLSQNDIGLLLQLEKDTEYENIIGIKKNIEQIKKLIADGEKVILISDMYLDVNTIRKMLIKADGVFKNIKIYVSSEVKLAKWSGNLYKFIHNKFAIDYIQWQHMGDNKDSDIAKARKLGIKTILAKYPTLLPIEKKHMLTYEDNCYFQLMVGTARNARLKKDRSVAEIIGSSVAGNILFSYTKWIVDESIKKGIKRLYFIARDGYILKKIADAIIKSKALDIKTHYIYGSRRAWRMPAYDGKKNSLRLLLSWSYPNKINTLGKLAEALHIKTVDLMKSLPVIKEGISSHLSYDTLCMYIKYLDEQSKFRIFLKKALLQEKKLVIGYLQQEIDISDADFAFVDLGGGGLTQGCMAMIMKEFCNYKICTFFFKMDKINLMKNCVYYTFLPSSLKSNLVIEMICRAPHGQTNGYTVDKNKIIPVLMKDEDQAIVEHGYNEYITGIINFAKNFSALLNKLHLSLNIKFVLLYINYIAKTPNKDILNFFANMPNSVTGREKEVITFAPKLTKEDIRDIYLWQHGAIHYRGTDAEFASLRCTKMQKQKIAYYKKNRKNIISRYITLYHKKNYLPSATRLDGIIYNLLGKNIVLYGAGKYGRTAYTDAKSQRINIVQWLDENYIRLAKTGLPVTGTIIDIGKVKFDCILITIINKRIAASIRDRIIAMGINKDKIVLLHDIITYLDA